MTADGSNLSISTGAHVIRFISLAYIMNGKEIGKMISLCCRDTKQPYKLNSVQANSIKKWLVLELVKIDG